MKIKTFSPGELVMLYDSRSAKKKLRPSWRGPFVVTGFGGDQHKSYTIRQICGTLIPRTFHGDHLKLFRLREGYLATGREERIPVYQNIRLGTANQKLPKDLRTVPGVYPTSSHPQVLQVHQVLAGSPSGSYFSYQHTPISEDVYTLPIHQPPLFRAIVPFTLNQLPRIHQTPDPLPLPIFQCTAITPYSKSPGQQLSSLQTSTSHFTAQRHSKSPDQQLSSLQTSTSHFTAQRHSKSPDQPFSNLQTSTSHFAAQGHPGSPNQQPASSHFTTQSQPFRSSSIPPTLKRAQSKHSPLSAYTEALYTLITMADGSSGEAPNANDGTMWSEFINLSPSPRKKSSRQSNQLETPMMPTQHGMASMQVPLEPVTLDTRTFAGVRNSPQIPLTNTTRNLTPTFLPINHASGLSHTYTYSHDFDPDLKAHHTQSARAPQSARPTQEVKTWKSYDSYEVEDHHEEEYDVDETETLPHHAETLPREVELSSSEGDPYDTDEEFEERTRASGGGKISKDTAITHSFQSENDTPEQEAGGKPPKRKAPSRRPEARRLKKAVEENDVTAALVHIAEYRKEYQEHIPAAEITRFNDLIQKCKSKTVAHQYKRSVLVPYERQHFDPLPGETPTPEPKKRTPAKRARRGKKSTSLSREEVGQALSILTYDAEGSRQSLGAETTPKRKRQPSRGRGSLSKKLKHQASPSTPQRQEPSQESSPTPMPRAYTPTTKHRQPPQKYIAPSSPSPEPSPDSPDRLRSWRIKYEGNKLARFPYPRGFVRSTGTKPHRRTQH